MTISQVVCEEMYPYSLGVGIWPFEPPSQPLVFERLLQNLNQTLTVSSGVKAPNGANSARKSVMVWCDFASAPHYYTINSLGCISLNLSSLAAPLCPPWGSNPRLQLSETSILNVNLPLRHLFEWALPTTHPESVRSLSFTRSTLLTQVTHARHHVKVDPVAGPSVLR